MINYSRVDLCLLEFPEPFKKQLSLMKKTHVKGLRAGTLINAFTLSDESFISVSFKTVIENT